MQLIRLVCEVDIQQVDGGIMQCAAKTLDMQPWTKSPVTVFISLRMKQCSVQKPVDVFHLLPSVRPL